MNILIVGGGELGSVIAGHLTSEKHNITIIEKSDLAAKKLSDELDAYVLTGSGTDVNVLSKSNLEKTELFLALTNDDNVNIVACNIVKVLSHYKAYTIAKVENALRYFSNPLLSHKDLGIDHLIATKLLSINKISALIEAPETFENIFFHDNGIKIVGVNIKPEFKGIDIPVRELVLRNKKWNKLRIVAINRNNKTSIPNGDSLIKPFDKIYIAGKSETLNELVRSEFPIEINLKKIIIFGGNRIGKELALRQSRLNRKVTLVEDNEKICEQLSRDLENVLIVKGTGTNPSVLSELDMKDAYVVCVTENDEQNIISAVLAKRSGAFKAVCNISNIAISSIINELRDIDSVFSTEDLALSEILTFCSRGEILTVHPIPNLRAETIKIRIREKLPIIDKQIKDIKFPKEMIIAAIVRDEKIIIPHGNDDLRINDLVILFILPSAKNAAKEIFSASGRS
ncbi:MAG: Trk system potassium transporter TrkA [Candidatus Delongbacteria bacterium]|nr:Trk system potassium transporter TrkA [Candidatus Delongbacteria bacterium]